MEFDVGDKVFLKVSPTRGIRRFGVCGKLSPRYIAPYEIIEKLSPVAYRLDLPINFEHVNNVFHISQLRKYVPDPDHAIILEALELAENQAYEERPVQILDRRVKYLHNKQIPLVKVLWANHTSSEATWETEEEMKVKYPHLF